jgi:ATP:ADP antiporter, AAA family
MREDGAPSLPPKEVVPSARPVSALFLPGERRRVAFAFAAFFLILCSYYILRPVRDEMAVQYGAAKLQWLFTGTFIFTLLVVPLFGWTVRVVPRTILLPAVYGFLIFNLLGFYAAFAAGITIYSAAAFFLWLSVFNLFVVSLFWSRMSDCFSTAESHRLYGYIAAGGTCGALAGPAITAVLAKHVATAHLLMLSIFLLAAAVACMLALPDRKAADDRAPARPLGGSIIAGIPLTLKLRDLRGIALLIICYTTVSTVLYIELVSQVGARFSSPSERTIFFASVDLAVNGLALILQMLGTRKVVSRFGLRTALSAVPLLLLAGIGLLGAWRSAVGFAALQTLHRAGEYALGKPGREMIYTTVDSESRYKAKNFIDTAVYRAGDAASAWVIAAIRTAGLDALLFVAVPAALLWLVNGFRLGGRHDRHESA